MTEKSIPKSSTGQTLGVARHQATYRSFRRNFRFCRLPHGNMNAEKRAVFKEVFAEFEARK